MGGCSKALKFVITIITWWVGVTKKWNCPLLFVTNLWCLQFFCKNVTSQLLKQEKRVAFFFNQRQLPKACWFWTIVKQKNVSLSCTTTLLSWQKEKKLLTSFVCFLLSSFWNSEKDKTTLKITVPKRQISWDFLKNFLSSKPQIFFFMLLYYL